MRSILNKAITFIPPRNILLFCFLLISILAGSTSVLGISKETYLQRVNESFTAIDSLITPAKDEDEQIRELREAETVAKVRRLMPPAETVDGTHVDNQWLEKALLEYEDNYTSETQRRAVLTQIMEQLKAIAAALTEMKHPKAATSTDSQKDVAKARLAEILRREEYAKKVNEENALSRLWRRLINWLRQLIPSGPQVEPGRARLLSQIAQIVIVVLALAVIAFALWKFLPRMLRSRTSKKKNAKSEARIVLGERLEPDQSSADLLAEAEALARDGQLRAAIRKGYIALLCELGDRKILGLAQHKTNRDYLRAVQNQESLYREMQMLTTTFEIHWYGFVPAEIEDWNTFRSRYHQALKQG